MLLYPPTVDFHAGVVVASKPAPDND